ncbi:LLM class flavin-dependent oxidoreductase [Chryseobacterium sp.]|uniref:LLM class flavin-dependent oxidoreductase n=1 Tax=Chryseobacterium sp. TaxID=1871047 RepID=UPI0025BFCD00|nr:LLM class flavin-dependent oxidoreductase [Chryseobacterium sp.]MBV8326779.1 LLM class flavin-dependent oxidoreductase [Chryseobacterium sp.]
MKIGLLDFGVRSPNINSLAVIEDLVDYAILADHLGYSRFWLAEHHNFDPLAAWLNPEVLLPIIAGATDQIRVGAGGIILSSHSPYRIAYTFKLLNNVFNDRIDLGIAKGYSNRNINSGKSGSQLRITESKEQIEQKLRDNQESLINYLNDEDQLLKEEIVIPPFKGIIPQLWSLTGSFRNFETLAKQGLNISRSLFHFGSDVSYNKDIITEYRELFMTYHGRMPEVSLAFSGACSTDGIRAKKSYENHSYGFIPDNIVGCPSLFHDRLSEYKENYNIDEFIFMNVALDPEERAEGLHLIADTLQLKQ